MVEGCYAPLFLYPRMDRNEHRWFWKISEPNNPAGPQLGDQMTDTDNENQEHARNAIRIIKPYKFAGTWVFDDDNTGLVREPFVEGADDIIDVMTGQMEGAEDGFGLIFSAQPFPGSTLQLLRVREEHGGWWYRADALDMEGWLCPALFLYFVEAPEQLHCKFTQDERSEA